ncbi:MAG: hypothetical protein MK212_03365 [Saprospiraceae bacterium]|nr:hypothetical protein [Saprospiraceae bacterium]
MNSTNVKVFKTPMAEITFYKKEKYIYQKYLSKNFAEVKDIEEHTQILSRELEGFLPVATISDIREVKGFSKAVRDYGGNTSSKLALGLAVIIKSGLSKVIGNIGTQLVRTDYPTRLFTNVDKAVEWLGSLDYTNR